MKDIPGLRQLIRKALKAKSSWINFEYDMTGGIDMSAIRDAARAEINWGHCSSFSTTVNEKIGVATIQLHK